MYKLIFTLTFLLLKYADSKCKNCNYLYCLFRNKIRIHNIKIYNSVFERVEQFRYLGTTLTNQNSIQEENKCRLKSQKACCHSVQNTISKTAHLEVFTDHWMYSVSLFASIFPYSKQKGTCTCCLCEVHSVRKEKKSCHTSNCFVAVRARHSNRFITPTI
jgi:hypothetical protein